MIVRMYAKLLANVPAYPSPSMVRTKMVSCHVWFRDEGEMTNRGALLQHTWASLLLQDCMEASNCGKT